RARGLAALLDRPVLLLQLRHAPSRPRVQLRRGSRCAAFFWLGFRLDGTRPPQGKLGRHVAEARIELLENRRIRPLSVVPQAHPPTPQDPASRARPRPPRVRSEPERGTCSARPHCDGPAGSPGLDTRRTPGPARAAVPRLAAIHRSLARPSPQAVAPGRGHAQPEAEPTVRGRQPASALSWRAAPRTRRAAPPTEAHPPRGGPPTQPLPHPVAPPPNRPHPRLPAARGYRAQRPLLLTQSGTSGPICPYQVLSHPQTSGALAGRP